MQPVFMYSPGANVSFVDSDITNNKGILEGSNGGGIFVESATVYMTNCNITGNTVWGVGGGIYTYSADTNTYLYLSNSTVAHNSTNAGPNTTRRGGGFYAREFSRVQIVTLRSMPMKVAVAVVSACTVRQEKLRW